MARRTIADCQKEIDTLKQQVEILSAELVLRTNYGAELSQELAGIRTELDQFPDETPDHILVQGRMHKDTVALVNRLQGLTGALNRTDVLVLGIGLLAKEQDSLKNRMTRRVRDLLSLSLIVLASCVPSRTYVKPISYPWQCEADVAVKDCTQLGYTVNTSNKYVAEMYGDAVCGAGVHSITPNAKADESLIICK